jgi:hypothetical protein
VAESSQTRFALLIATLVGSAAILATARLEQHADRSGPEVVAPASRRPVWRADTEWVRPEVSVASGPRTLAFSASGLEPSAAQGLAVDLVTRCGPTDGADGGVTRRTTDAAGLLPVGEVPAGCELELNAVDPLVVLRQDTDERVSVLPAGSLHVTAVDLEDRPIAGVTVEDPRKPTRWPRARCVTGSDGACDVRCRTGELGMVSLLGPGSEKTFQTVRCDGSTERITLRPGRTVTVTVLGPQGPFVTPLHLLLEGESLRLRKRRWEPGTLRFGGSTRRAMLLQVSEASVPPFQTVKLPAGDDDVALTVGPFEPRRLEVWVRRDEDGPPERLHYVWVACEGANRLGLLPQPSDDPGLEHARIEYAPAGPCVISRKMREDEPEYEQVTVNPPAVVTLKRK